MSTIVCVLIVTAVLGLYFPSTRNVGLLCAAVLASLHPLPVIIGFLIMVGLWYLKKLAS